jgi:hypothetical protein
MLVPHHYDTDHNDFRTIVRQSVTGSPLGVLAREGEMLSPLISLGFGGGELNSNLTKELPDNACFS